MKQNLNKKQHAGIETPHWVIWLICGLFFGFLGGFFTARSATMFGPYTDLYGVGLVFFAISAIFDLLLLKDLITEAHIVAMEVFYGRKRAVKTSDTAEETPHEEQKMIKSHKRQNSVIGKKLAKRIAEDIDD